MTKNRYQYEFKKFKSGKRKGQTYCNVRSVKTGKTIRTVSSKKKVQSAVKSAKQQKTRAEDKAIDEKLRKTAKRHGGNYADVKEQYEKDLKIEKEKEKKRVKRLRKQGGKPLGRKSKSIKKDILEKIDRSCGYVTTMRCYWVVRYDKQSPYVEAQYAESYEGDKFNLACYEIDEISLPIIEREKSDKHYHIVRGSNSGACVRLIDRETEQTIRRHEHGVGC